MDTSAWAFKGGYCTDLISNKILCASPYFENVCIQPMMCLQGFSYLSEIGARGLLKLVKEHLDHKNWENLMQSKVTGTPF